jgi:Spy/CpxP family protein refolding chaperone
MVKNTFLILLLSLFASALSAQPGQMRGRGGIERVEAEKIAFFTRYLDLSSQEAREFWPVYDNYQDRKSNLLRERYSLSKTFSQASDDIKEKEAEEMADRYIALQIREAELAKEFHEKFKRVLPARKVMMFYQAENEFRMQLLRRLRGGGRGPGPRDPGIE